MIQTMLGSVLFARESHKHPAELRNMVTSPGGTSAEAIYQMEKGVSAPYFQKRSGPRINAPSRLGGRNSPSPEAEGLSSLR
ncbi:MAG: pyrroline-5-carboxylate reductase dimerization domain-containing protein [Pyrinomonadaceae bacterium]